MNGRIVLLLFWAIKLTAGQGAITTKGSITATVEVSQRTRLLSKSEKGEKSSEKGGKGESGKADEESTSDDGSVVASAEEEEPVMIIVTPLKMSNLTESSIEQGSTPESTENSSEQTYSAEDNVIENAASSIVQSEDSPSAENATKTSPPVEESKMHCPLPGYLDYAIPDNTFFRYPHTRDNTSVVFSVTDTCSFLIEDATGIQDSVRKSNPLEWLDASVYYFGGAPRNRKASILTGLEAPSHVDLDLLERGASVFEVVIDGNSASVAGDKSIDWIFLTEMEAKDFEYFVASVIRYAPAIFLTNDSSACGNGPFCSIIGNALCYHDPKNKSLGIIHLNGDEDIYDDSFKWLRDCVEVLECSYNGHGAFPYSSCPAFAINGTTFSFTEDNETGSVSFECPTENAALLIAEMVEMLSIDPFHALEMGAPENEPGSLHDTNTTDGM